jgi:plasmid stabilization system protein ParE
MARYSIRHDPSAADELQEAADWYTQQDPRAGASFVAAIKAKLQEIAKRPHRWPLEKYGTRQALVRKFKYSIVFRERKGVIEIIAYAHASRRPGYWRKRLRDSS